MSTTSGSHGFLGEEFLTWLWYRLETEGGEFDLGDGRVVGVAIDDFLLFAPSDEDETEQTLRKGAPTRTAEAAASLRRGRRVRRARCVFALGDQQWSLTIDGPTLGLTGVRLPEDPEEAETPGDRSRERAANFLLIRELVQQVYGEFLRVRLRADYLATDGERQAQWMAQHAS